MRRAPTCAAIGATEGDEFLVRGDRFGMDHGFLLGETVVLINDDGTDVPCFRSDRTGLVQFVHLNDVEKISAGDDERFSQMLKLIQGSSSASHLMKNGDVPRVYYLYDEWRVDVLLVGHSMMGDYDED